MLRNILFPFFEKPEIVSDVQIVAQLKSNEYITTFSQTSEEDTTLNFSIVKTKAERFGTWDVLILSKYKVEKLADYILSLQDCTERDPLFIDCDCCSEILKVEIDEAENIVYFEIYSKHWNLPKRIFSTESYFPLADAKKLAKQLKDFLTKKES